MPTRTLTTRPESTLRATPDDRLQTLWQLGRAAASQGRRPASYFTSPAERAAYQRGYDEGARERLQTLWQLGWEQASQGREPASDFASTAERAAYLRGFGEATRDLGELGILAQRQQQRQRATTTTTQHQPHELRRSTQQNDEGNSMARRASRYEKSTWEAGFSAGAAGRSALFGTDDPDALRLYEQGYRAGMAARAQRAAAGPPLTQSWGSAFLGGYVPTSRRRDPRGGNGAADGTFDGLLYTLRQYGPRA
jgi:hypothetical protein